MKMSLRPRSLQFNPRLCIVPRSAFAALAAVSLIVESHAFPVIPLFYDMPNGHGQASGGSLNYWDKAYNGSGSTTTDGAPLSNGSGDLTDGVIAGANWFAVENVAGTGPYVGWRSINPTITFHFTPGTFLDSFTIHVDDSNGSGGVTLPASVGYAVNGGLAAIVPLTDPVGSAPTSYTFNVNGSATTLALTLNQRTGWVFMSEVEFSGRTSVPDGGSTAGLLALAAGALVLLAKRRR